jgi:hypothetical protein
MVSKSGLSAICRHLAGGPAWMHAKITPLFRPANHNRLSRRLTSRFLRGSVAKVRMCRL